MYTKLRRFSPLSLIIPSPFFVHRSSSLNLPIILPFNCRQAIRIPLEEILRWALEVSLHIRAGRQTDPLPRASGNFAAMARDVRIEEGKQFNQLRIAASLTAFTRGAEIRRLSLRADRDDKETAFCI
jgi:hypothetical protein